jgi:hypothetical protein
VLLARTIRQAYARWCDVWVVSDNQALLDKCACGTWKCEVPVGCCDTLLETQELWKGHDRVIVLLGDVCYTEQCLWHIDRNRGDVAFFVDRRNQETFAVAFAISLAPVMARVCDLLVAGGGGRVSDAGFKRLRLELLSRKIVPETILIVDETQDFDNEAQYRAFKKGKGKYV